MRLFLCIYVVCIQSYHPLSTFAQGLEPEIPADAQAAGMSVRLNEIMWMGTDLSTADEWIELTAIPTATGADIVTGRILLDGWTLVSVRDGVEENIASLTGQSIGSGEYLIVSNYGAEESRLKTVPSIVTTSVALPNTQLLLRLKAPDGTIVDEVDDGIGVPFAGSNESGGVKASMERINASISGTLRENWRTATASRGFDAGYALMGTPGYENASIEPPDDVPPSEAQHMQALKWSGSLLIGWRPSESSDLASQTLTLESASAELLHDITLPASATGIVIEGVHEAHMAVLTSMDESGNKSPGVRIQIEPLSKPFISELLPDPPGTDDREWIEIINQHAFTVDLQSFVLSSGNKTFRFPAASGSILQPGAIALLPQSLTALALPNAGGDVRLSFLGKVIDSFTYDETPEGISRGRLETISMPFCRATPGLANEALAPVVYIDGLMPGLVQPSTLNVSVRALSGSIAGAQCAWDFGDGYTYSGCNPPSHAMKTIGTVALRLHIRDYCGNTMEQVVSMEIQGGAKARKSISTEKNLAQTCTPTVFSGLTLNEVFPKPGIGGEEWVELRNVSGRDVDVCGWSIDDREGGSKPFILENRRIGSGEYVVLTKQETGLVFNDDADIVRLIAPLPGGGTGVVFSFPYTDAKEGEAFAYREDGEWIWTPFLTPGSTNQFRSIDLSMLAAPVILSAVIPNPHGTDDGEEWVELTNRTNRPQWLNGWMLENEKGVTIALHGTVLRRYETIRLQLKRMTLRNTEGNIRLIDAKGSMRSVLAWGEAPDGHIISRESIAHEKAEKWVVTKRGKLNVRLVGSGNRRWRTDVHLAGIVVFSEENNSELQRLYLEYINMLRALTLNKNIELDNSTKESFYVWVDGMDIQTFLLRSGLAFVDTSGAFERQYEYAIYEEEARKEKRGIWRTQELAEIVGQEKKRRLWAGKIEREGLVLTVGPDSGLVEDGELLTLKTNVPADIYRIVESGAERPYIGGSITRDGPMRFRAVFRDGESSITTDVERAFIMKRDHYPQCLVMSEAYPSPQKGSWEWLEFYNKCDQGIALVGWSIADRTSRKNVGATVDQQIQPRSFAILSGALLPVSLNNAGDDIVLRAPNGTIMAYMHYPSIKKSYSYALAGDAFCLTRKATPGSPNECVKGDSKPTKRTKSRTVPVGLKTKYVYASDMATASGSIIDYENQLRGQLLSDGNIIKEADTGRIALSILLSCVVVTVGFGILYEIQRRRR